MSEENMGDNELAEAYQAAVARNNEMRRQLHAILRKRNTVAHRNSLRFQTLTQKLRRNIEMHSELIAELEASIIANGGTVIPQMLTAAEACALHSLHSWSRT